MPRSRSCGQPASSSAGGPDLLRYGSHPSQYAVLTLPAGPGPWPVAVVLHGGFWRTRYGADLGAPLAEELTRRGYAAYNVEYRRVGDDPVAGGGGWPTTCLDVAAAVDLLTGDGQRAAAGRLDLSRVVAVGHSAGGHLAGWLAGRATLPGGTPGAGPVVGLTGFVSQAGVLDLDLAIADHLGAGATRDFLGPGAEEPAVRALASPLARLPSGVPAICVHGTADDVVPISQSERFVATATRAGDHARLVPVAGEDHFAALDPGSATWAASLAALQELADTGPST